VRDRGRIHDGPHAQSNSRDCAQRSLTPRTGAPHKNVNLTHPVESWAARSAAIRAAKGVLLRVPLNPTAPGVNQRNTLPSGSVTVMIVLLNDVLM